MNNSFSCLCMNVYLLITFFNIASSDDSYSITECHTQISPCKCRMYKKMLDVDCSNKGLWKIPKLPKNVTKLDLSRNNIKSLAGFPFEGLTKLEHLNLEQNRLVLQKNIFYSGLFQSLTSLRVLSFKNNTKDEQTIEYPGEIFAELVSLQELKIDALSNLTFDVNFKKLKNLHKLDLSGITGMCDMKSVTTETFIHVKSVRYLDISKCNLKSVEEGAFSFLHNLEILEISHNKELGFSSLPNITYNINLTSIKSFRVDNINCLTGLGKMLFKRDLENIKNTSIEHLSLARNRLEILEFGVLKNLPKTLKLLSVAENKLTMGMYMFEYSFLSNLRELNVSLQLKPPKITESLIENCWENSESCNLHSYDDQHSNKMSWSIYLDEINMSIRPLYTVYAPPKLERFYENSSRLYTKIPEFKVHAPSLRYIFMQDNMLYEWIGPVYGLENLTHLDLSNNFCSNISNDFFKYAVGLEVLQIQHNFIGPVLETDFEGVILENQGRLKYLDITDNRIMQLPSAVFKNLKNLETLVLRSNQISDWTVSLGHMMTLKFLDLSKNRLGSISSVERNELGQLFANNNLTVNLADNDITCSCQNLDFLNWMAKHTGRFRDMEHYTCSSLNPTHFRFSNFVESLEILQKFCKSYLIWYIVGAVSFTIMVSICVGLAIKRNIWTIRYYLYKVKHNSFRKNPYTSIQNHSHGHYEFDAFISFSSRDSAFVLSELIPQLETRYGLKLLIRFRDVHFMPGETTSNNIMNAIGDSKKTICLITKSYLKSNWRDYELNMAKIEGIKERGRLNYVYLILMPEAKDNCDLKKIMDLMRKNYYIEYPSDERLCEDFWSRLADIIKQD